MASADRINFPADPQAYEPPSAAKSVAVADPLLPNADAKQQFKSGYSAPPTAPSSLNEALRSSGAHAPSIPATGPPTPPLEEASKPAPQPSKLIVKRQLTAHLTTPTTGVFVVGITGGILLIGGLLSDWARRKRSPAREPVLIPGMSDASPADVVGPPDYLLFFGLDATAREQDVLRAYRERSWTVHPDHGGDPAAFKEMQRRFEQSLAFVRRRSRQAGRP